MIIRGFFYAVYFSGYLSNFCLTASPSDKNLMGVVNCN